MNIVTSFVHPPIPVRSMDWQAYDSDTYDGAEDSRCPIGRGRTEAAAVADLREQIAEAGSVMSEARKILTIADRTPKERRNMAEFYAVRCEWKDDLQIAWFADGSVLMMTFDEDLAPTEMIEVAS